MRKVVVASFALAMILIAVSIAKISLHPEARSVAAAAGGPCTFPTVVSATPEETAWRLFVAANCPVNRSEVVWESWIEQQQFYPLSGHVGPSLLAQHVSFRFHSSPLAVAAARQRGLQHVASVAGPNTGCDQPANAPPPNFVANAPICEEVRINPAATMFLASHNLQVRSGQTLAAQQGIDIQFPTPAIEVKADWIPATSFTTRFTCAAPPAGVHVEQVGNVCYALAGIHISSKLIKNWVWATFEPQNLFTNPFRCITYRKCIDRWGSLPAESSGGQPGFTAQTVALRTLMKQAGLPPEFYNYRLDGVQFDFKNPDGSPSLLGNSIIEGENVGISTDHASCITCHSRSSIAKDGTDFFLKGIVQTPPQVGPAYVVPPGWIARDFVWSMAFACPNVNGSAEQSHCLQAVSLMNGGNR